MADYTDALKVVDDRTIATGLLLVAALNSQLGEKATALLFEASRRLDRQ